MRCLELTICSITSEDGVKVSLEQVPVNVLILGGLGRLAKGQNQDVGNIITGIVVVSGGPVFLGLANIGEDSGPVGEEVLGQGGNELGGVLEDLGPVLNSLDVLLHVLAVSEVLGKLLDDVSNFLNSLDDVLEVSLGEVRNGVGDLLLEGLGVGEALLDLRKVILLDHTEDKSSNELFNTCGVHAVLGGNDLSKESSGSHI